MSKKRSKQPELNNNQVFIGNLPADMFLSSFATCYPMITTPSDVQLTFDNVTEDTLAINHGSPLQAPTYCFGSPTEIAIPTPTTGAFPINLDHSGDPIIVNNISGEAYNRSTVQRLFRTQTAKPIHPDQVNDPDWIPRHTADLRRHPDADLYHVACDPKRIPFSLAVRLIPVYTTGPSGQTIYQAWALPHLNNALRDPELQLFNNFSLTITLQRKTTLSSHSLISWDLIHLFQTMIESVASNNIITFQQDNSTFSGPHFACLAVSTRRSSLLSDPTRTPDPRTKFLHKSTRKRKFLHQTNPKLQFYTRRTRRRNSCAKRHYRRKSNANTTDSPEIHSQQLISDAETTYDEHAQTTQQLPGTQPNLAFLPPNSPETSSSHTETPSNSPPTAKSTTGPLKRFSDAFSGILTPKT
ncbi:hypothetical protein MHU86_17942 [Fragilaria crotonensis]|nr:hypothetical protein MHU86_17942 [Fragilaria crotonensis]